MRRQLTVQGIPRVFRGRTEYTPSHDYLRWNKTICTVKSKVFRARRCPSALPVDSTSHRPRANISESPELEVQRSTDGKRSPRPPRRKRHSRRYTAGSFPSRTRDTPGLAAADQTNRSRKRQRLLRRVRMGDGGSGAGERQNLTQSASHPPTLPSLQARLRCDRKSRVQPLTDGVSLREHPTPR